MEKEQKEDIVKEQERNILPEDWLSRNVGKCKYCGRDIGIDELVCSDCVEERKIKSKRNLGIVYICSLILGTIAIILMAQSGQDSYYSHMDFQDCKGKSGFVDDCCVSCNEQDYRFLRHKQFSPGLLRDGVDECYCLNCDDETIKLW